MRAALAAAALMLALSSSAAVAAGCSFQTARHLAEMRDLSAIEQIDIRTAKYRKWVRDGLRILTSPAPNIPDALKRGFRATITIRYPFGSCAYEARIRQNGDWKDHIRFRDGHIDRSLDVRMRTGNIGGVVRFKLFLPETRRGPAEIFATETMRALGFLAPRSFAVPVVHDGVEIEMLFQEKPAKELLEAHGRREGPLFEGDEALLWDEIGFVADRRPGIRQFGLARLVNDAWAARGAASATMSATALAELQAIYASRSFAAGEQMYLHAEALERRRPGRFDAVMFALNARHGLTPHNRQFHWNALAGEFEPIYYDGDVSYASVDLSNMPQLDARRFAETMSPVRLKAIRSEIAALDAEALAARVERLAKLEIPSREVRAWLTIMDENLTRLAAKVAGVDAAGEGRPPPPPSLSAMAEELPRRAAPVLGAATASVALDISDDRAQVRTCDTSDCVEGAISLAMLADRMSGAGLRGDSPLDFHLGGAVAPASEITEIATLGLSIRHAPGAKAYWDEAKKTMVFEQGRYGDWFVVLGGVLGEVSVAFRPAPGAVAQGSQRFNAYGVTGCLTFFETEFRGARIDASGGGCEDVVNLVGGSGRIARLSVADAPFDAVDLDFADIEISEAVIARAGNDCFDVSSGRYRIGLMAVEACGDKGLSVGEASMLTVEKMTAAVAAIGVSSKDSSTVEIDAATFTDAPVCYEAFNKKQEFDGAALRIGMLDCDGIGKADAMSLVEADGRRM